MNIVRIIPAPPREGQSSGYRLTNGTKVVLADGSELQGVMRVTITGEKDAVWKATIECACEPPEFDAIQAQIALTAEPARWAGIEQGEERAWPERADDGFPENSEILNWVVGYRGEPNIPAASDLWEFGPNTTNFGGEPRTKEPERSSRWDWLLKLWEFK